MKEVKSMSSIEALREMLAKTLNESLHDYMTFLRFKSVSSEIEHKQQVRACALWLQSYLQKMEFETELWETKGHPIVFASYLEAGPDKPTLLIYNYYDVQPVDLIYEWDYPPFEPSIHSGNIYGRGAEDNKGQCFYVITALKMLLKNHKKLPINIKLIIEGEGACGSFHLSQLLKMKRNDKKLQADYLALVCTTIPKKDLPAVTLGARGLVTMELELRGAYSDLNAGSHGGLAFNPNRALINMLDKLYDESGRVTVPGFYDNVASIDQSDKDLFYNTFDAEEYQRLFGAAPIGGEIEYPPLERNWFRPTLEVNGVVGGYSGSGFKAVIPSRATAKVSCYLVPFQDPHEIGMLVMRYLKQLVPSEMILNVHIHQGMGKAVRVSPSSTIAQAFAKAFTDVLHAPCRFILSGDGIPVAQDLAEASKSDLIFVGLGLDKDHAHAPNEHFGIDRFEKGVLMICRAIEHLKDANY